MSDEPTTADPQTTPPPAAGGPGGPGGPRMPDYRGEELDAERGPGLGCFWFQVLLLGCFVVLTPLTVKLGWPPVASAILLFVTIGLLLFVGQTVIFLLRIVAAEHRGRRRPLASQTRTVGEIEAAADADEGPAPQAADAEEGPAPAPATPDQGPAAVERSEHNGSVRQ